MTKELKPLLEEFLEEMLFLYGSEIDKRTLSDRSSVKRLFDIWLDVIEKSGVGKKTFLKRWEVLKREYKGSCIPKPAHFLSVEIQKEVEAYEPEKPKTAEELAKDESARKRAFEKMKNINKQ